MGAAILDDRLHAPLRGGIHHRISIRKSDAQRCRFGFQRRATAGMRCKKCRDLPGVDYAEPTLEVACDFLQWSVSPQRGDHRSDVRRPGSLIPHDQQADMVPIPPVGLTMTRKMADLLHVDVGRYRAHASRSRACGKLVAVPVVRNLRQLRRPGRVCQLDYLSRLDRRRTGHYRRASANRSAAAGGMARLLRELKELAGRAKLFRPGRIRFAI